MTIKFVNCEISVPKKYVESVKSIEKVENEYIVTLNDGFEFEWNDSTCVELNKKDVLSSIRTIQAVNAVVETTEVVAEVVATEVSEEIIATEVSEEIIATEVSEVVIATEVSEVVIATEVVATEVSEVVASYTKAQLKKLETITNSTKVAVVALQNQFDSQIEFDYNSKIISLFNSKSYSEHSPLLTFELPFGKDGKRFKKFQVSDNTVKVFTSGLFHDVNELDSINLFVEGEVFVSVSMNDIALVAYEYHRKRSFISMLRKNKQSKLRALQEKTAMQERNKINAEIQKNFNDTLRAKVVFEFLILGNKAEQIEKKYPNATTILSFFNLTEKHRNNFNGVSNGTIFGTLKRYGRLDLLKLLEIHFYGINNNVQRFKNVNGIPC